MAAWYDIIIASKKGIIIMHNIHVRNIDDDLMLDLKALALKKSISMNKLIITLLQKVIGKTPRTVICHDFDKFSGTWTPEETAEFEKNITDFSKIDEALWQ